MGKLVLSGNRTRGRLADQPTTAAFNPVTGLAWAHLYYAGGPNFVALGLSNGASVTTWPDEIAANAADLTGGSATYAAAASAFNSKPSVASPASGSGKMHTTTVATAAKVSTPYSIICICQFGNVSGTQYVFDGANSGSTGNRVLFRLVAPNWNLYAGTSRNGSSSVSVAQIYPARVYITSGNDVLTVAGTTEVSGVDAGSPQWEGVTTGGALTVQHSGAIALWGIYAGDITADTNWSAFQAWVSSTYGVSIS